MSIVNMRNNFMSDIDVSSMSSVAETSGRDDGSRQNVTGVPDEAGPGTVRCRFGILGQASIK